MSIQIKSMSPEVAWPVVTEGEKYKKIDLRAAKHIIQLYFRMKDYPSDYYGNYFPGSGKSVRYHFAKRNIQRQKKDYGSWRNIWSLSQIEFAEALVFQAADDVGQAELVEHLKKKVAARTKAKQSAAERQVMKDIIQKSSAIASERVLHRHWDLAYRVYVLDENHELNEKLNTVAIPEIKVEQDKILEDIDAGRPTPGPTYIACKPPLMIFGAGREVRWEQDVNGVTYTVFLRNRAERYDDYLAKRQVVVHIGSAGPAKMMVDPFTGRAKPMFVDFDLKGDAYISGVIAKQEKSKRAKMAKPPQAILYLIKATDKKRGAGTRVLSLWCDLMAGYKVKDWVAVGVGEEGAGFFNALAKKKKIRITNRDRSTWHIKCL